MNLSIIIAIYQIEKVLDDCLNSIYQQLADNDIEVLMVNDGSKDHCEDICLSYAQKDSRFIYHKKENGGLSDARNYGLSHASKDYIWFVDGDDVLEKDAFMKLKQLTNIDWDVLYFDYCEFEGRTSLFSIHEVEGWKSGKEYLLSPPNAWNKIMKKSLLAQEQFQFPKGIWYEDRATAAIHVSYSDKLYYSKEVLYKYRVRQESLMNQSQYNERMLDIITAIEMMHAQAGTQYHDECESNAIGNLLYQSAFRLLPFQRILELNQCVDTCKSLYPHCEDNPYLKNRSKLYRFTIHCILKKRYKLVNLIRYIYQKGGAR